MTTNEKVLKETLRFREELPELLKTLPGKWVVFRDGKVHSSHDDKRAAHRAGLSAFGLDGGQIIIQVAEQRPYPISAGVLYGHI